MIFLFYFFLKLHPYSDMFLDDEEDSLSIDQSNAIIMVKEEILA